MYLPLSMECNSSGWVGGLVGGGRGGGGLTT